MRSSDFSVKEVAVFQAVLALAGQGVDLTAVRMQQIADAAGMGKGTLYEYFSSKEQLLTDTVNWCVLHELETVAALPDTAESFDALMQSTADYIEDLVFQRAEAYKMLANILHRCRGPEDLAEMKQTWGVRIREQMARSLAMARRSRPVAGDVDGEFFSYALYSAIMGYASALFRIAMRGAPNEAECARCRTDFLHMMDKCLR